MYARKEIILKFQIGFAAKISNFFENPNADIFGARTQKFPKISIWNVIIINFLDFEKFSLTLSRDSEKMLKLDKFEKIQYFQN